MKFNLTKIAASLAMAFVANGAHAVAVTSMTLADTIDSNIAGANVNFVADAFGGGSGATGGIVGGVDGAGQDRMQGAFRFNLINTDTYASSDLFFGNVGGGVINMAGSTAGSFTTGFDFGGNNFIPFNNGPITADITGGVLSFSQFAFAGNFLTPNGTILFNLPPDSAVTVNNLIQTGFTPGAEAYAYRISWNHLIVSDATGPAGGGYDGFNARWMLEGTMVTAAPVPEASTYGMMLAGLGLVGMAVRRRRNFVK